jgi:hypothetical protein
MPTISFHAPPALYKKFAAAARRSRVKPSQFVRAAVEEKLQRTPPAVTHGFLAGTATLSADYDPEAPVIPESDWKHLKKGARA